MQIFVQFVLFLDVHSHFLSLLASYQCQLMISITLILTILFFVFGNALGFRLLNGLLPGKARGSSSSRSTAQQVKCVASRNAASRFSLNMATKVSGVAFFVEDVAQSAKFYENKLSPLSRSEDTAEFSIGDSAKMTLKKFSKRKEEDRDFEKGDVSDTIYRFAREKMCE